MKLIMENWRQYKKSIQEGPVTMDRYGNWETDPNKGGGGDEYVNYPDRYRPSPNKGEAPPRENTPEEQYLMSKNELDVLVNTYVGKRPSMAKIRETVHFLVARYSKDPKVLKELEKMKSLTIKQEEEIAVRTSKKAFNVLFTRSQSPDIDNITPGKSGKAAGSVRFGLDSDGYWSARDFTIWRDDSWRSTIYPKIHKALRYKMRTFHNVSGKDLKFAGAKDKNTEKIEDELAFNSNVASKYIEFILMLRAAQYASTYVHEMAHVFENVRIGKRGSGVPKGARHMNEVSAVKRELAFIDSMEEGFTKDIFTNNSFPGFFGLWGIVTDEQARMSVTSKKDSKAGTLYLIQKFFAMLRKNAKKYGETHQHALDKIKLNQKQKNKKLAKP